VTRWVLGLLAGLALVSASMPAPLAWGQTQSPGGRRAILDTRGAFFALSVADLGASTQWYRDRLGLDLTFSVPSSGGVAVNVLEGGGLMVELLHFDSAGPDPCGTGDPSRCHGQFKAGLFVTDLAKTLERLAARGVPVAFGPYPAQPNQPANAIIRDNAGNLIQLFEK
jgi:catechol 2,3-dioxygenase-like lactoylglutathione lyase family enzyme